MARDVRIKINVDSRELDKAQQKIQGIKNSSPIKLKILFDDKLLNSSMNQLKNKLNTQMTMNVNTTQAIKSLHSLSSELDKIASKINALSNKNININVNTLQIANNLSSQLSSQLSGQLSSGLSSSLGNALGSFLGTSLGQHLPNQILANTDRELRRGDSFINRNHSSYGQAKSEYRYPSDTRKRFDAVRQSQLDRIDAKIVMDSIFGSGNKKSKNETEQRSKNETEQRSKNETEQRSKLNQNDLNVLKFMGTNSGSINFSRIFGSIGSGLSNGFNRVFDPGGNLQSLGYSRGNIFRTVAGTHLSNLYSANQGNPSTLNNLSSRVSGGIRNNPITRYFESTGLNQSLRTFSTSLQSTGASVLKWGLAGAGLFALHGIINTVSSVFSNLVNVTKQMIVTGMEFNAQKEMQKATYTAMSMYETKDPITGKMDKTKATSISNELYKNIETFAKDTIMETQGVAEAVKMSMGYGINAKGSFSLVKKMSEFTGGSSDKLYGATRAMAQAYGYGKLRAQEKNQLINSDVPIKQILDAYGNSDKYAQAHGGKTSKTPLSSKETIAWKDVAEAIDYATNKGGQYYGVIDSLSNIMTGKIAKLKDTVLITLGNTFESVFNKIKGDPMDQLTKKIEEIGKTLEKVKFDAVFDEGSKGANKVFKKLVEISGLEWGDNPAKNAESITKALKSIVKTLADVSTGVLDVIGDFKTFWDKMDKWGDDWDEKYGPYLELPFEREARIAKESRAKAAKGKDISAPIKGMLSSIYGDSRDNGTRKHAGIDYAAPKGTNVSSVYGGKVSKIGYDKDGYGKYMDVFNAATGLTERFAHLSSTVLKVGDKVTKGQKVGQSGDTGSPGSFHLHYEIRKDGNAKGAGFGYKGSLNPEKELAKGIKTTKKTTSKTTSNDAGSKYDSYFEKYGEQYGVDSELLKAIAKQETGGSFNPKAKSGAGAMGLMQFMPGTWAAYGSGSAYNAENSINAGGKYMSNLLNKFGGDTEKALAAYNAGPNAVEKAINKDSVNWLSLLPKETRDYVPAVMSNFESYGGNIADNVTASMYEVDMENKNKEVEILKSKWEQATKVYETSKTQSNFDAMKNAYDTYANARNDYNNSYLEDLELEKSLILSQTEDINQQAEIMKAWQDNHSLFLSIQKQKYDLANAKWEGNKSDKTLKALADDAYANYQSSRNDYNNKWLKGNDLIKASLEAQIEDQQRLNSLLNEQKNIMDNVVNSYKNLFKFSDLFQKQKIERFSPGKLERRTSKNFKNWTKWAENLSKLEAMGISPETMYELRNMGVESLGITEGLLRASADQRNKIMSNISGISNIALNQSATIFKHEIDGTIFVKSDSGEFSLTKEQVQKLIDQALHIGTNRFVR